MVGARTVKDDSVYMDADKTSVTFDDTTIGQTKTATVKFFGFNLTATSDVSVEGANKSEFTLSDDTLTPDEANAAAGVEITVTFAPTTTAGARSAQIRVSNATDNVNIVIPINAKGVES